jgi:tetratricopeptide (TPR) repeat protein
MPSPELRVSNHRLDSWKEIAAFFGRDERTVKRWEKERALPVHRMPGGLRSGVFAYPAELSQWLKDPALPAAESSDQDFKTAAENGSRVVAIREPESAIPTPIRPQPVPPGSSKLRLVAILGPLLVIVLGALIVKHQIIKHQIPRQQTSAATVNIAPAVHRPTPEAEELYLKGRYFWNKRTPEDLNKALDLFTQSIVRDPSYAQAYVGLADCYNLLREYSAMPSSEAYPRALAAAKKAVELDDNSAEAHNSLAFVTFYWSWDAPTAEREFKRAIVLNPDYVAAHHWYATFLLALERYPEAIAEIEKARKLDPSSTPIMADKGFILYSAGQPEQSLALLKQLEAREPGFLSPHRYLAEIYFASNDYPDYFAESRKVAQLRHDTAALAIVNAAERGFAEGGAHGMWQNMLPVEKKFYLQGELPAYPLAQTYSELGEKHEALKYLSEAYDKRDEAIVVINNDRAFDALRDNPAFRDLRARFSQPRLN